MIVNVTSKISQIYDVWPENYLIVYLVGSNKIFSSYKIQMYEWNI